LHFLGTHPFWQSLPVKKPLQLPLYLSLHTHTTPDSSGSQSDSESIAAPALIHKPLVLTEAPAVIHTTPIPPPISPSSSNSSSLSESSSSSSDYSPPNHQNLKMTTTNLTPIIPHVEHHSLHHAPILTAGVLIPALILEFKDACMDFFTNAKGGVSEDVQVIRILPYFKDPIIRGWISSDCPHFSTLKFDTFMKLLCSKFLSKQWEDKLLSKILHDHLCPNQDFLTWSTNLQQQNCILRNTNSQLDEKRLREQISIAVDTDLRIAARECRVNEAESLRDFLDIYNLCDEKRCSAEKRICSIINESYRSNKNNSKDGNYHPYKRDECPSNSTTTSSESTSSRPPKLTPLEIEIIKVCSGCFKCHKIYQSKEHINTESSKKTCEFPTKKKY
jgi:hypothetical protein